MGADLIVDVMILPVQGDDSPKIRENHDLIQQRIADIPMVNLRNAFYQWTGEYPEEVVGMEEDYSWEQEIKMRLDDAVDNLFPSEERYIPRDVVFSKVGDTWIMISGGTSWGDATDSFNDSCLLQEANLVYPAPS